MALKIAVYAICLNEEKFVRRFVESCRDADMIIVSDTGSTDATVALLEELGVTVHHLSIKPWRFDHARNASLAVVPEDVDVCVALDLDQVLMPDWRRVVEKAWKPPANRIVYTLAWGQNVDGSPRRVLDNHIHARHGFVWLYPCHECIVADGIPEHIVIARHLRVDHYPDNEKSRGHYLPLLQLAVEEDPDNARHALYLGRELHTHDRYQEAIAELERFLAFPRPRGDAERNVAMRLISQCHDRMGDQAARLKWCRAAVEDGPEIRGAWTELAWALYQNKMWAECYTNAARALSLSDATAYYGVEADSGVLPDDMACICAWRLGRWTDALAHGRRALELAPGVERIRLNVERMEAVLGARNAVAGFNAGDAQAIAQSSTR